MFDKLIKFVANATRAEEQRKDEKRREAEDKTRPVAPSLFTVERKAGDLVGPSKAKAERHREREQHWTKELEVAEKDLREKGVSVEAYDPNTATYMNTSAYGTGTICSGAISNAAQTFQPRVDQKYLDAVKNAKQKMLEHRDKAVAYEKYARAFALDPDRLIKLTVEDVHYFGLEG